MLKMNSNASIVVDNLWKEYTRGEAHRRSGTLYELLSDTLSLPSKLLGLKRRAPTTSDDRFWALQALSFEACPGDVIGVIGRNGAGKSTLLKILSRITAPTRGKVLTRGRVTSLLEVGTGFHGELTGRENVFLNGAILGMSRQEVTRNFDAIVTFAEVERFIDTPVKRYSSGMYVRLAFAVAAHLDSDVLIIDEVLAVGDRQFQERCMGRMSELSKAQARTILFVSHNLDAVHRLCKTALYLREGRNVAFGPVSTVVADYINRGSARSDGESLLEITERSGNGRARVKAVSIEDRESQLSVAVLEPGRDYCFFVTVETAEPTGISGCYASIEITDERGIRVFLVSSQIEDIPLSLSPGQTTVGCAINCFNLAPGSYSMSIYLGRPAGEELDFLKDAISLTVAGGDFFGTGHPGLPDHCKMLTRSSWKIC